MKRCQWFAGAMIAIVLACPAAAQVVVIANGSPITEYDIQQRMKLEASATHKTAPRQQIIDDLIDDRLKISKAKVYGLEVTDAEVNSAFEGIATRQHDHCSTILSGSRTLRYFSEHGQGAHPRRIDLAATDPR